MLKASVLFVDVRAPWGCSWRWLQEGCRQKCSLSTAVSVHLHVSVHMQAPTWWLSYLSTLEKLISRLQHCSFSHGWKRQRADAEMVNSLTNYKTAQRINSPLKVQLLWLLSPKTDRICDPTHVQVELKPVAWTEETCELTQRFQFGWINLSPLELYSSIITWFHIFLYSYLAV